MRVVFDTNIVLSGMLWGGLPKQALERIHLEKAVLISSTPLLEELQGVLARDKFSAQLAKLGHTPQSIMQLYIALVEVAEPVALGRVIEDDPKDDKVIECAVGGRAVMVVSGDSHLLKLQSYASIEIITVQEFLKRTE